MTARCWIKPVRLAVVFERPGAAPVRIDCTDGKKAVLAAVRLLLTQRRLQHGDKLTVKATG